MTISIGRTVLYTLSKFNADTINKRREDFAKYRATHPGYEDTGYMAHYGNKVSEGDVFPAVVVRVFEAANSANLQVTLDGTDTFWACSVVEGTVGGTWAWPNKV